jgi:hypothetical protein
LSNRRKAKVKYTRVVQWSAQGDTFRLDMLGEDQEVHQIEVSAECAGALVAALAAESEKLSGPDKEQQFIRPTGMQTAKTAQGEPVILMYLKGGVELPLVFKPESITVLIAELEGLMGSVQPGSQMRWR